MTPGLHLGEGRVLRLRVGVQGQETSLVVMESMTGLLSVSKLLSFCGFRSFPCMVGGGSVPSPRALARSRHMTLCKD